MRVLVCGSRTFTDESIVMRLLAGFLDPTLVVIEGGAKGADGIAAVWAESRPEGCGHVTFPADWDTHGKAAGPIRNQQMLTEGCPDVVLAFIDKPLAESRGTADMVRRARKSGVRTYVIEPPMPADPTQPVPGPTREQIRAVIAGEPSDAREPGDQWMEWGHDGLSAKWVVNVDGLTDAVEALLPARPSRCGFMSLGRQCQLPPVHDGEDHKLDLTEPARPSPTDDDLIHSFEALEQRYFPNRVAERLRENETAEEFGARIAAEVLAGARAEIERLRALHIGTQLLEHLAAAA